MTRVFFTTVCRASAATTLLLSIPACSERNPQGPELRNDIPTLSGQNVTRFPERYPIVERHVISGVIDAEGRCRFERRLEGRVGTELEVFESILEYDPASCEFIVARHPPNLAPDHIRNSFQTIRWAGASQGEMDAIPSAMLEDGDSIYQTVLEEWKPSSLVQDCDMQIGNNGWAHGIMWTESVTGWLDLNRSSQSTLFFYNGDCVQWIKSWLTTWWRSETGWRLNDHIHQLIPRDAQWTRVDGVGFQRVSNSIFCAFITVTVWYWPNEIRHFRDGQITWMPSLTIDQGSCPLTLQPHYFWTAFP